MQAFPTPTIHTVREGAEPIRLAVHEQGEGPAVVFSHGFPELAYSWRYQLPATAAADRKNKLPFRHHRYLRF
jgi:pimeloyl-ACP methyl ester carboxylesterase